MATSKTLPTVTLSFHSSGSGKYRFGINLKDSYKHFGCQGRNVVITEGNTILFAQTTCGQYKYQEETNCLKPKKGFDLYSQEISDFINNEKQKDSKTTGLSCELYEKSNFILLIIVSRVPNNEDDKKNT